MFELSFVSFARGVSPEIEPIGHARIGIRLAVACAHPIQIPVAPGFDLGANSGLGDGRVGALEPRQFAVISGIAASLVVVAVAGGVAELIRLLDQFHLLLEISETNASKVVYRHHGGGGHQGDDENEVG
ncbi:hypothetical protein ACHAWF_008774 [Thalassiosira exigua]